MAYPSVTYSFSNSTTADATQVNQNYTDLINGLSDGTKDLSVSAITAAGNVTFNGNTAIGNASGDTLTITASLASSIAIGTTFSYDIGAATLGLRYLFLGSSDSAARSTKLAGATVASSYTFTLPVSGGTSGYYLQTDGSGTTSWTIPGMTYTAQTTTYSAVINDYVRVTSGTFTVTLPTAVGFSGKSIAIKNGGSGVVTIATTSSQTIFLTSALASGVIKMATVGDFILLTSDGANWVVDVFNVFVGARAHTSTTTVSGSPALIIFTTETYDPQGDYATGTGLYTVSIPGTYLVESAIYCDGTGVADDLVQTYVYVDSSAAVENVDRVDGDRSHISYLVNGQVKVTAGQTISTRFNIASASPSITSSRNYMQIVRVGN